MSSADASVAYYSYHNITLLSNEAFGDWFESAVNGWVNTNIYCLHNQWNKRHTAVVKIVSAHNFVNAFFTHSIQTLHSLFMNKGNKLIYAKHEIVNCLH